MLYLVATPIGNLSDMTYRAVEVLLSCDYILCEDTRHSSHLLKHYHISKPLKSYHKFNETECEATILNDLKNGLNIALICDSGTPGISDPGHSLVIGCKQAGLSVTVIPGACAAITALTLSGFDTAPFQFCGFLPKKPSQLREALVAILHYPGTTVCYESPHRIKETLSLMASLTNRTVAVARELTKLHEECLEGDPETLASHFALHPPRGEMVLLIRGNTEEDDFHDITPQAHIALLQERYGLSLKEALKMAAHLRKSPKKNLYKLIHNNDESTD